MGILLPIYACDLIYAIFFFEYKKPQVQYIRLNDIIFQEFGIICIMQYFQAVGIIDIADFHAEDYFIHLT